MLEKFDFQIIKRLIRMLNDFQMNFPFTPSRMYNYVRSRQLEGTFEFGPKIGTFPITSLRISKGWGFPSEDAWPYAEAAKNWPQLEEPIDIDKLAKENRIGVYQRIRSLNECKLILSQKNVLISSLPVYKQWYNSKDGKIKMPEPGEINKGFHAILICGYNDLKSELIFVNSWGENWGDNGFGFLPYSYFETLAIEAWTIADINGNIPVYKEKKIRIINYGIPDLLAKIIHVVEIFDNEINEFIGWSFGVIRDNYLDIEEFFIHPDYRHRNYGVQLSKEVLNLSKELGLPIRMWIPEADIDRDNFYVVEKILKRMKLKYKESEVSWARYECRKFFK